MGKYRSRLQIIADILSIIGDGSKKTRVMYQANLSYRLLCRYLDNVLDADLAEYGKDELYSLTSKGEEFLSRYGDYSKRCRTLETHLNDVGIEKTRLEKMCVISGKAKNGLRRMSRQKAPRKPES